MYIFTTSFTKIIVALSLTYVWIYQMDACLKFSNLSSCFMWISHFSPLTFWSYHPNNIVLRTSIMGIDFTYFNIVRAMHYAEFIKPTLHAHKSEHSRYTISYMFQHFMSTIINYESSLYIIFSILFPFLSEYHVYSTVLHIILTVSKVFVTKYKCEICLVFIAGGMRV